MVFRERAPLSAFVLLPRQRGPGPLFGIERERVLKFAVRVIKGEQDSISIAFARTERLGEMPAEDVDPMKRRNAFRHYRSQ